MTTKVFFCFDHEDLADERIDLVRKHWQSKEGHEDAGFFDEQDVKDFTLSGNASLKRMIDTGLEHSSATCVLIGTNTSARRWVRYAIVESVQRGNRLIGVHINAIPDRLRRTKPLGRNPLEHLALSFTADGASIKVLQYSNGAWIPAPDNPGWPLSKPTSAERRGRSMQLSTMYRLHDWVTDNGPENFDGWLGL
jgi:hypothetical protein